MEETYDFVILGTGLTECVLSGLLSANGYKVLHMDIHDYYGAECASLNLDQVFKMFRGQEKAPDTYGNSRDYLIDLVPKFMMSGEELVNILIHTKVARYLSFRQVAGSYVYVNGRLSKVPANDIEALKSPLMGFLEKRRVKKFFEFIAMYNEKDTTTHQGVDINKTPMHEVYEKFGISEDTQRFIGHSLALHLDNSYLYRPLKDTYERIKLYNESLSRHGKSPYIYPLYGLGELPQGFARLGAIYGATYMLDKPFDGVEYDSGGRVIGVRSQGELARCSAVIADPTYFLEKTRKIGQVIRSICIMNHPVPKTNTDTSDLADSCQIIIPQSGNRKSNIYITVVSHAHSVCAPGYYVAMINTYREKPNAHPEDEISQAFEILGPVLDKFTYLSDLYEPLHDGARDGIFISKSYDATTNFQTITDDVKDMYRRVTGQELNLESKEWPHLVNEEE